MTKRRGFMDDLSSETQSARAKKNRNSSPWRCGPICSTARAHKMFKEHSVKKPRKPVVKRWKPEYRIDAEQGIVYGLRGRPLVRTKMQINHKNGVRHDNRIINLELVTASENVKHSFSHGSSCAKGERNNSAKLTESQVREIRESNARSLDLAAQYSVHKNTILRIRSGKLWAHLT